MEFLREFTRNFRILYYVILGLDPRISVLGNSKFIFDEIPRSSRGMTQGRNSSFRNSLYGIPKLAVAAVKTRLQDFRAIFSFKAAALA